MAVFGAVVPIGSMLMGFATAVSAQTAWYLVVPVLFVGFDIPIFQAVFISVLMDLFDGVVLTFINGYGGWIDWKYGTLFGVMTAICSIPPALLLRQIIQQELEFVKFTAAFIPAVMAVAFLFKGASILRQDKKLKKELKAAEEMKEQGLNNSIDIDIDVDVESGKKKRFSKLFLKKEGLSNDEISLRLEMGEKEVIFEDESDEEIESDIKLDHEEYQKNSEYQALTEEEALRFESLDQEREGKDRDSEEMNGHDLSNPKQYKKMKNSKYEQIQEDDGDDERNGSTDPLQKDINTNFDNDSKFKSCCRKWKSREDLISTCEGFTFRKWKLSKRAIWAWSILFHAALGLFMGNFFNFFNFFFLLFFKKNFLFFEIIIIQKKKRNLICWRRNIFCIYFC